MVPDRTRTTSSPPGGINAATLRDALLRVRARLREAGEYTVDTVDRAAAAIEKEMADRLRRLGLRDAR